MNMSTLPSRATATAYHPPENNEAWVSVKYGRGVGYVAIAVCGRGCR